MKKWLSGICIIGGILLILFPWLKDVHDRKVQDTIVLEWQESLRNIEEPLPEIEKSEELDVDTKNKKQEKHTVIEAATERNDVQVESDSLAEGILIIEKIELELPILTGATKENLNISAASIIDTGKPGEAGNYSIAAHRSRTYGKNFNRLDELEEEDIIKIVTKETEYQYKVTEKLYVKPKEVWVLEGNKKDKEITLITCHPMVNPTERLVVKGVIIE